MNELESKMLASLAKDLWGTATCYADVSGDKLDASLVRAARGLEVEYLKQKRVYEVVPRPEVLRPGTGKFIMGCQLDVKLIMQAAIDKILSEIKPKVTAILRTRKHYSAGELIMQFEAHIWSRMEIHSGGIFHASNYLLEKLDRVQASFLRELGVSEEYAYLTFNFAPTQLRRNIGILGLLHKRF